MAGLFKRLFGRKKREDSAANVRIQKRQEELAKRIGHIPGVKIPGVLEARDRGRLPPSGRRKQTMGWGGWHTLTSSNVDRIRYNQITKKCQAVYKPHGRHPSRLYEYSGVEQVVFDAWLRTHSPGQYQWYVIRAYGYPYVLLATGVSTRPASEDIHAGEPFAVPKEIEDFQRSRGRSSVDQVPTAHGVTPPPPEFWRQFRR